MWQDLVPCELLDWGPQFFSSYWPETSLSSLQHEPLHWAACFIKTNKGERKRWANWKPKSLSNPIFEVTSQHFCCAMFVRGKSLGPNCTQAQSIVQGHGCQEVGSLGDILEAVYPKKKKLKFSPIWQMWVTVTFRKSFRISNFLSFLFGDGFSV